MPSSETAPTPAGGAGTRRITDRMWIVAGGAVLLAGIVLAFQGARLSDASGNPDLALRLWPGSAQAASHAAEAALRAGDPASARRFALAAIQGSAQDSSALRALSAALRAQGDADGAIAATVLAARHGWRDGFAQAEMMREARKQGEWGPAVLAADALLRIDFAAGEAMDTMIAALSDPQGRTALAERLSAGPKWRGDFFKRASAAARDNPAMFADFAAQLDRQGAAPEADEIQPILEDMIDSGNAPVAVAIWRAANGGTREDPRSGIVDGGFGRLADGTIRFGTFGWRTYTNADTQIDTVSRSDFEHDPAMRVRVNTRDRRRRAAQTLLLAPGSYRLSWVARLDEAPASAFQWQVSCLTDRARLASADAVADSPGQWSTRELRFTVPHGCAREELALFAGGTGSSAATAAFDEVRLAPAP